MSESRVREIRLPSWKNVALFGLVGCSLAWGAAQSISTRLRNAKLSEESFAQMITRRPTSNIDVEAMWPKAEVLASNRSWFIGQVDPFTVPEDHAEYDVYRARMELHASHVEEPLIELVHELALAVDRASGERVGLGVQPPTCKTPKSMRAFVRTWVSEDETLLELDRWDRGRVEFEVILVAGAGPDQHSVARLPARTLSEFAPLAPWGSDEAYMEIESSERGHQPPVEVPLDQNGRLPLEYLLLPKAPTKSFIPRGFFVRSRQAFITSWHRNLTHDSTNPPVITAKNATLLPPLIQVGSQVHSLELRIFCSAENWCEETTNEQTWKKTVKVNGQLL